MLNSINKSVMCKVVGIYTHSQPFGPFLLRTNNNAQIFLRCFLHMNTFENLVLTACQEKLMRLVCSVCCGHNSESWNLRF